MRNYIVLLTLLLVSLCSAQDYKFGKVPKELFKQTECSYEPEADAEVLYRKRKQYFSFSQEEGFKLVTEINERIIVYKKDGVDQVNKEITYYNEKSSGTREDVLGLKGVVFNLVNGKVVSNKLGKDGIFDERDNQYWKTKKVAFPNVQEGSIIDFKYKLESPFLTSISDVYIEDFVPIRKFEYDLAVPEYFVFRYYQNQMALAIGLNVIESKRERSINLKNTTRSGWNTVKSSTDYSRTTINENAYTVTLENIKSVPNEDYVNNINNYRNKLLWELQYTKSINTGAVKNYSGNWNSVVKNVWESDSFGRQIQKQGYYQQELDAALAGIDGQNEQIATIFNFVKSKVKWNGFYSYRANDGVRNAYKNATGNVAEVNLMLVSMLKYAGIEAHPILISTKNNGIPLFPTLKGFNYVICGVNINGSVVLLDATSSLSMPNILPSRVINWEGLLIKGKDSFSWVNLYPKKMSADTSLISAKIEEDFSVSGKVREQYTNHSALGFRSRMIGLPEADQLKKLKDAYDDLEISEMTFKNLDDNIGKPATLSYEFVMDDAVEEIGDKLYISPLLFMQMEENPFKEEKRNFPIDFTYPSKYKKLITIEIPEGYQVESTPENKKISLEDKLGDLMYQISVNGNKIQLSYNLQVNYPVVPVDYYPDLKLLFKETVEKHSEKVVLSKK